VRLACVRHAASVNSEPGSNSPVLLGVFPHSDSLFSFQRASFADYYCSNFPAVVKGFVFPSRLLPPPSGNCFCNPIRLPCQPLSSVFFPPRRANPAAFQATVIYIQSPPPCQAPFLKKVARGSRPVFSFGPFGGTGFPACAVSVVGCVSRTIFSAHPRDRRYFNTQSPDHVRRGGNPLNNCLGLPKNRPGISKLPASMLNQ
jgi:hypothetical protein